MYLIFQNFILFVLLENYFENSDILGSITGKPYGVYRSEDQGETWYQYDTTGNLLI